MKTFGIRHPILYGLLLYIVTFIITLFVMLLFVTAGLSNEQSQIISRILIGMVLLLIFRSCVHWENSGKGIRVMLPGLLFCIWNCFYNFQAGNTLNASMVLQAAFMALAPAIYEEALFRIIVIDRCKQAGWKPMETMLASSLLFGVVHLTNLAGNSLINVLIQVCYATVIGMVLAAVYQKHFDPISIILLHFLVDFSNDLFINQTAQTTTLTLVLFVVVLVVMAGYAIAVTRTIKTDRMEGE